MSWSGTLWSFLIRGPNYITVYIFVYIYIYKFILFLSPLDSPPHHPIIQKGWSISVPLSSFYHLKLRYMALLVLLETVNHWKSSPCAPNIRIVLFFLYAGIWCHIVSHTHGFQVFQIKSLRNPGLIKFLFQPFFTLHTDCPLNFYNSSATWRNSKSKATGLRGGTLVVG